MKIIFLYPKWTAEYGKFVAWFAKKAGVWPPLDLAYLAAVAENLGHEVRIIDGEAENMSLEKMIEETENFRPDFIGLTAATPFFHVVSKLAKGLKQRISGVPIMIGGPHITMLKEEAFYPFFDYAFIGEAEGSFPLFLEQYKKGGDISEVKGILYREKGNVKFTGVDKNYWKQRNNSEGLEDINLALKENNKIIQDLVEKNKLIKKAAEVIIDTLQGKGKLLIAGNGGSAADAQHISGELVGRFKKERRALPVIALTTNTSILTAIANDYSFEKVFSRQIEALAEKGDLFLGISTSGNSLNVIEALKTAKKIGCQTICLSGKTGGEMEGNCDILITVDSDETPRIQEAHILIGHIICQIVEKNIFEKQ